MPTSVMERRVLVSELALRGDKNHQVKQLLPVLYILTPLCFAWAIQRDLSSQQHTSEQAIIIKWTQFSLKHPSIHPNFGTVMYCTGTIKSLPKHFPNLSAHTKLRSACHGIANVPSHNTPLSKCDRTPTGIISPGKNDWREIFFPSCCYRDEHRL